MFLFFKKFLLDKNYKRESLRGFSLLELVVVISIFLIITVVVVADIPNFREKSTLDLTASEIATYVRGAQVYGASQRAAESQQPDIKYGVHFSLSTPNSFYLFKNDVTTVEEPYQIQGFKVSKITVVPRTGASLGVNNIDIIFKSNPYTSSIGTQLEPLIYDDFSVPGPQPRTDVKSVRIQINSERGSGFTCIKVYANGQITPASCDDD